MLMAIHPKLPMRNKTITKKFYTEQLGFTIWGGDYADYLMVERDNLQIHFFEFKNLDTHKNYGQIYLRTTAIHALYQSFLDCGVKIHPGGPLVLKAWGQYEFSILDPDHNLLTFGQPAG